MIKYFNLFRLAALLFVLASCSKSDAPGGGGSGGTGGGGGGGTPGPKFTAVRTVLQTNCAVSGCHTTPNPQNGINFSDNNHIVAQKDRIKLRAVDQAGTPNQMPPPPAQPLPSSERQKITDWINAGGRITD